MEESPEKSKGPKKASRLRLQKFAVFSEHALSVAELWTVAMLMTVVWITAFGTAIWILGCPTRRLALVLGNLNTNWKVCLLLLIPLFYRTIKEVLLRIKKWPFGLESQEPEQIEHEHTKTEVKQDTTGEES